MDEYGVEGREATLSRRAWIGGALGMAAAGAVAFDGCYLELRKLSITRHALTPLAGPGSAPVHAAQVSDLHLKGIGVREEAVFRALDAERPDLILLTGDIIDRANSVPLLEAFLAELPNEGRKLAILGNWERWCGVDIDRLRNVYAKHGCELLLNETTRVELGPTQLHVVGVDNAVNGKPDLLAALEGTPSDAQRLFLAHCPVQREDILADLTAAGVTANGIVLSGHTHGGQVRILGLAPALPRGSGIYVAGWYPATGLDMYVSRGIGTSSFPIRIGASPELAMFTWG